MRTYGELKFKDDKWILDIGNEPHVAIKLKGLFEGIPKYKVSPFEFDNHIETCADLLWFTQRYPMIISDFDLRKLKRQKNKFVSKNNEIESLLTPDYVPKELKFNDGLHARDYQSQFVDVLFKVERILCGDELGLGKTVTAIASMQKITLPAFVVVQSHLTRHWREKIEQFTNLDVHVIEGRTPYNLPSADVYIVKYTCVSGWIDLFMKMKYKMVVFDEIQEVRRHESKKHKASKQLSIGAKYVLALSATPIYNLGAEIFNIMEVVKPGAMGNVGDFKREWCSYGDQVRDPKALGTFLREKFLFLKRTRKEVGRELPPINSIVHTVEYDEEKVKEAEDLMKTLALQVMKGSFVERGQAARELDMRMRKITGVSKAKYVATYVKMLVQGGEPVVLAGWHREVYDIWLDEFKDLRVVMYTGSESPTQKEQAKKDFIEGRADVFIISLRSGIGLDGLQHRCKTVIFGELDWSPQIHNQVIGRVDRDGQENQVTAIYLISEEGSDLPIIDLLGIKSSQAHNIINPLGAIDEKVNDESRIKMLAKHFLESQNISSETIEG